MNKYLVRIQAYTAEEVIVESPSGEDILAWRGNDDLPCETVAIFEDMDERFSTNGYWRISEIRAVNSLVKE